MRRVSPRDDPSSSADIKHLRRRARALGISIRKRRGSKSQSSPAYDLIDTTSGGVLNGRLSDADDIDRALERIAADRGGIEPGEAPARFCESCGRDQAFIQGGVELTQGPDGAYMCPSCAFRYAAQDPSLQATPPSSAAIEQTSHERATSKLQRWAAPAAALAGLMAVVIATQQLAFRQTPDAEGEVLGDIATGAPRTSGPEDSGGHHVSVAPSTAAPVTPVEGRAVVTTGEGTVATWTGQYGETRIQVIVPVRNRGTGWVSLPRSASRYQVLDGSGRELASGFFTVALPVTIGPDQTSYLVETVSASFVAGSGTPTVEADVVGVPVAKPTAALRVTDLRADTGPDGGLQVTGVVHNDGPATTGWLIAGAVLVDAEQRPVGAVYDPGKIRPLPAGALVRFDTSYPGAPPPPGEGVTLVGVAFEALDPLEE